jgi:hypothetical protein
MRTARHRELMTSKLKLNETQFANRCNLTCGPSKFHQNLLLFYVNFSKIYYFFLQNATFFSKPNSALFDRSHCSRMRSETMCLWRRDWMFAPTIRYQFKRHLFTRRPCTGPHLWAGPEGDCNCWDTGIEISFNFSRSRQFAFVRNACGH